MDVKRPQRKNRRRLKLAVYACLCVLAVALITYGLSRLPKAAPSVSRSTVLTDTVKRGQMLRNVRGLGTLIPEEIRQIAAPVEGRVEQKFVKPGETVGPGTVLVTLYALLERLTANNAKGEYYLTDIVALANAEGRACIVVEGSAEEAIGVNSRAEL